MTCRSPLNSVKILKQTIRNIHLLPASVVVMVLAQPAAIAAPPEMQTPAPVIYLADNLDEKDNLGWCIDTVGRGLADKLHAHSCKPRGGDVQFQYNGDTGQIESVPYTGKCVTVADLGKFDLLDCDSAKEQQFSFNEDGTIRLLQDGAQCMAVGDESRSAGPFQSRELLLATCDEVETERKTWIAKSG